MNSKKTVSAVLATALVLSVTSSAAFASNSSKNSADYVYGTMKISYHDFYLGENVDTTKGVTSTDYVDAVSSATMNKYTNQNLNAGTYTSENADNTMGYINGVIFPVKVSAEDYAKLKSASNFDELGFTELTEVPAVYKELTVDNGVLSFSEAEGKTETVDASYTFSTSSRYGDYQISFNNVNDIFNDNVVYGVVLETAEGDDYGLYSQENIWKNTKLAWSTGFTTEAHGCPLRSEPYEAIMGETLDNVQYITANGIYNFTMNQYVAIKHNGSIDVNDAYITDGSTSCLVSDIPNDFEPQVTVEGLDSTYSNDKLNFTNAVPNKYTAVLSDAKGKYASASTDFTLKTTAQASLKDGQLLLDDKTDGVADYISAFTSISITDSNGGVIKYIEKERGKPTYTADIFDANGVIDVDAQYTAATTTGKGASAVTTYEYGSVFGVDGEYQIVIQANGYDTATLSYTVNREPSAPESSEESSNYESSNEDSNVVSDESSFEPSEPSDVESSEETSNNEPSEVNSNTENTSSTNTSNGKDAGTVATGANETAAGIALVFIAAALVASILYRFKKS